jgi:threonine/homoserine/homoserine lactone efflux protein
MTPVHRSRRRTIVLVVAGALAIAVHIGLGGALLASSGWASGAADVVLVVVLGKVVLIVLGRRAIRRRESAHARAAEPEGAEGPDQWSA